MKLQFEDDLDYQLEAIEAACGLFRGQQERIDTFQVSPPGREWQKRLGETDGMGYGNRLTLLDDEVLANLQAVQRASHLPVDESLYGGDFTVEMETGTGKTYVYLRTIFELSRRYGFTKFVIVVPSVAIRAGVAKSIEITADHFARLYDGERLDHFVYDSKQPNQIPEFARSSRVKVMVATVAAINKKDVNRIYQEHEQAGGRKPIELLSQTRPFVIIDEPQKVDGGLRGQGRQAIERMNPLCTLRYSATHEPDPSHHMIYRLGPVAAYRRGLVKRIEVASADIQHAYNKPFVRLVSARSRASVVEAQLELHVATRAGSVRPVSRWLRDGDDLADETKRREIYAGYSVGRIDRRGKSPIVEIKTPEGPQFLENGQSLNDVPPETMDAEMIRRTIREHLEKERTLRGHGIKVLSLFFVDSVADYRGEHLQTEDGKAAERAVGRLATLFEREYDAMRRHPDFNTLFEDPDFAHPTELVHEGYFSIDKKGGYKDTKESTQAGREEAGRAYDLILRDKERLLSLDEPLKFIFSHSALREGWDNPNVFQVCALREITSEQARRQTIGRGLRLPVDQQGVRQREESINVLTVVARESYEDFAENLQREIEEARGVAFRAIDVGRLVDIRVRADGTKQSEDFGTERAKELVSWLKAERLIDRSGKATRKLQTQISENAVSLPLTLQQFEAPITQRLSEIVDPLPIHDANKRLSAKPRRVILESEVFRSLWDRIKVRTTYRVAFDNDDLIDKCTQAFAEAPPVERVRLQWRRADLKIAESGIEAEETETSATITIDESDVELPDPLSVLQNRTHLTRRSICKILVESGRLKDFQRNPQRFLDIAAKVINERKERVLAGGVQYRRIGDDAFFAQELIAEEVSGYLKDLVPTQGQEDGLRNGKPPKSLHDHVRVDSKVERQFVIGLDKNAAIKVYAKLPSWFRVETPLGSYNPDWAVVADTDEGERLFLVVETKGSLFQEDLRDREGLKIDCGKRHFAAVGGSDLNRARLIQATEVNDVLANASDLSCGRQHSS